MREIKISYLSLILSAAVVLMGIYIINLKADLTSVTREQQKVNSIDDAGEENLKFVEAFFNYKSTNERYNSIKDLTTEKGFHSTFPSGMTMPKDVSVESRSDNVKIYRSASNNEKMEFYTELDVSTRFKDQESVQTYLVKTSLIKDKARGWKVDDIQVTAALGSEEIQ